MMPSPASFTDKANAYISAVLSGEQVACRLVKLACQRQLDDLERAAAGDPEFPYRFDLERAERVCRFVEMMPHVKGAWAKALDPAERLIKLEPWQCFILTTVFGWVDLETGGRRFRTAYEEVARKNAKSTKTSAISNYMTVADGEAGADCFCAATKREQAKGIVFRDAKTMVERSPDYRSHFGVRAMANQISARDGSFFKPIDAQGMTQDGLNIHFCCNDELHAWRGRDLYDALDTGQGSRLQSLMWNITTAGHDQSGVCYEQRLYAARILERVITDETFFGIIYTIDKEDDWRDPANWPKANPNLGVSCYRADMQRQLTKAKQSPKSAKAFKMKRLNIWVNAGTEWMNMEKWHACADSTLRIEDFADDPCIVSLDLASKLDLIAAPRVIERAGHVYCFSRFYLPAGTVEESDNASYPGWAADGALTVTPGLVADYDLIEEDITGDEERGLEGDADRLWIKEIAYDPHQATMLISHLIAAGLVCVKVNPTVLNFSEAMKEIERLVIAGRFHHDGNPVMTWCISNVTAQEDRKDNIYPRKERPHLKIDGAVALIAAMRRITAHQEGAGGASYLENSEVVML